jgi:hypothetical protein
MAKRKGYKVRKAIPTSAAMSIRFDQRADGGVFKDFRPSLIYVRRKRVTLQVKFSTIPSASLRWGSGRVAT